MSSTPTPQPRRDRSFNPNVLEDNEKSLEERGDMSFLQHLDILRWHIIRSLIAIVGCTILAFVFKSFVVDLIILGPTTPEFYTFQWLCKLADIVESPTLCIDSLPPASDVLYNRKLTGQFTLHLLISFIAGFIVAFPYVFWEIWRFIKPALYQDEKKSARGTVFVVSLLFFIGIAFGYFLIVPMSYHFFITYEFTPNITNEIDFTSYTSILTNMVLLCGLMFQLPVAVYYMSTVGILSPQIMKSQRRIAIVVIFIISAVFTPADVMSQLLVAIPLLILYEVSILVSRTVEKRIK